jgi:hypothetical protein
MSLILRRRERGDSGAVAVIVAICAIVLFGTAAMAVDLGNSWSRKRSAQTDADFAALAGATKLPASTPVQMQQARDVAYKYLTDNLPRDDNGTGINPEPDYSDGNPDNGEITFPDANTIKVLTQRVHVSFGLAGAIGFQGNNPQAQAIAAVRSPKKVLPFFLDINCDSGQQIIKNPNNGTGYSFESPIQGGPNRPVASTFTPATITQYASGTVGDITGNNLAGILTQVALIASDGSQVLINPPAITTPNPLDANHIRFPIPVLGVTGTWYVQVRTPGNDWSSDNISGGQAAPSFVVQPGTPTSCGESATGDFGVLDSPRNSPSVASNSQLLDFNLALGLDHGLACFPGSTMPPGVDCPLGSPGSPLPDPNTSDNCRTHPANTAIPGGVLDIAPPNDNANCIDVDNGLSASATMQGLITGGNDAGTSFTGRFTQNTDMGCPAGPNGTGRPRTLAVNSTSYTINNDTPDCYFASPGTTMTQLLTANTVLFNSKIYDCPRFFIVPVIDASISPPNGFYPIVNFRGVFVTDEGVGTAPSTNNGVELNGGGTQLNALKVFVFPLAALPDAPNSSGGTIPFIGTGPKVPVLID